MPSFNEALTRSHESRSSACYRSMRNSPDPSQQNPHASQPLEPSQPSSAHKTGLETASSSSDMSDCTDQAQGSKKRGEFLDINGCSSFCDEVPGNDEKAHHTNSVFSGAIHASSWHGSLPHRPKPTPQASTPIPTIPAQSPNFQDMDRLIETDSPSDTLKERLTGRCQELLKAKLS